ncbi:MAG: Asp-tRNA(Asn)/Glu-tRNA(Gln) amidotransferase GatCAB subunit C [Planctomycetes bacterium]|jgi:aspartyl-tRNA(Asn)/glutamyl-tRNA(Gln) amidotransferase subunit C|nr:Asp-tRNA(Asn)/Glu-tRNA(Gln) amidotransferase GatCAB subunit C [Planctomycetota bacterium]
MSTTPAESAENPDPQALVRRLGELSRLNLAPEEVRATAPHLERILEAFQELEQAQLDEEPPETIAAPGAGRQDTATPSLAPDRLLCNAPERIENFYGVPKTIGGPA